MEEDFKIWDWVVCNVKCKYYSDIGEYIYCNKKMYSKIIMIEERTYNKGETKVYYYIEWVDWVIEKKNLHSPSYEELRNYFI